MLLSAVNNCQQISIDNSFYERRSNCNYRSGDNSGKVCLKNPRVHFALTTCFCWSMFSTSTSLKSSQVCLLLSNLCSKIRVWRKDGCGGTKYLSFRPYFNLNHHQYICHIRSLSLLSCVGLTVLSFLAHRPWMSSEVAIMRLLGGVPACTLSCSL